MKKKENPFMDVVNLEKHVTAIDNLIADGKLVVDMFQGTAAMDTYTWLYYSDKDQLMLGFCVMLRKWINFQRSWKKGELLRMIEEGNYQYLAEDEIETLAKQKTIHESMKNRVFPILLQREKLSGNLSDEQKRQYLTEYVNSRYCLWPDAAPVLVLCIGTNGNLIASVEQFSQSLKYDTPHE